MLKNHIIEIITSQNDPLKKWTEYKTQYVGWYEIDYKSRYIIKRDLRYLNTRRWKKEDIGKVPKPSYIDIDSYSNIIINNKTLKTTTVLHKQKRRANND